MDYVHVRGRRVDGDRAATTFSLQVDGRTITVDAPSPVPVREEIEVWGEVVEHEIVASGYRDLPDELPTRIRAVAAAPVPSPPAIISAQRRTILIVFAVLVAVSMIPIDETTPYYRFWMLLVLSLAIGSAHTKLAPPDLRPRSELVAMLVIAFYVALAIAFYVATMDGAPRWLHVVAPALFVAQSWISLLLRRGRLRALYRVADAARDGDVGIVAADGDHWFSFASSHEMRRYERREIALAGTAPRTGMRVLVETRERPASVYASWHDPRAEVAHIRVWDRWLTLIAAPLAAVFGVFAYLALSS